MQFPRPNSPGLRRGSGDSSSTRSRASNGGGHHRVQFTDNSNLGVDGGSEGSSAAGPVQLLTDCLTALVAVACIGGVSTLLAFLHVLVRPFSVTVYRRLASQLGAASFIDSIALLLPNTKIYVTGDSDLPTPVGTSLLVSNHLVDGDWWAIFMLGRCIGLRGSIKVFMRNEYLKISIPNEDGGGGSRTNGVSATASTTLSSSASGSSFTTNRATANAKPPHANGVGSTTTGSSSSPTSSQQHHPYYPQDLSILAKLLHQFLEFPLINGEDYGSNRNQLFQLLRSFAEHDGTAAAPTHLLYFPEGWSQHNGADRRSVLAMSNEFAQREARPQLKHLLLPRARGFNSSLECLRESSPVVYDVTMASVGYDGSLPPSIKLSAPSLWMILRQTFPREFHIRIKRYSMEEVLQDRSWLDKRWVEKDRLLSHFARNQSFPVDGRGYCRHRVLDSRFYSLESSIASLVRLLLIPFAVPLLLLLSIPLFWTFLWIWLIHRVYRTIFSDRSLRGATDGSDTIVVEESGQTPGSSSAGTPFCPATPFASPSVTSWRDLLSNSRDNNNDASPSS